MAQTEVLVASGLYRFVRNPMYVSVLIVISGQALLMGQALLFAYASVMLLVFHLNVLFHEEPTLRRRFGRIVRKLLPARGPLVAASGAVARVRYSSLLTTAATVCANRGGLAPCSGPGGESSRAPG